MVKIKYIVIALCCYLPAIFAVVSPLINKQQEQIFNQQLTVAEKSLKYFAASAGIPLLANDYITLNNIIRGGAAGNEIEYVAITDLHGRIRAHTNTDQIGREFVLQDNALSLDPAAPDFSRRIFKKWNRRGILDLTADITFNKKKIGVIHLGLAADYLAEQLSQVKSQAVKTVFPPALLLFVILVFLGLRLWKKYYQCRYRFAEPSGPASVRETGEAGAASPVIDNGESNFIAGELDQFTHNSSLTRVLSQPVNTPSPYASRKQATILFASIKNFNEYAGDGNPEDIIHALNEYIRLASDVIGSHGGYVDKIIGDAVIGIFGVSVYRTDHSERAVRAAWQLQQQLLTASLAQKNPLLGMVRIGISSGVVLSGNIGAHSKVEYSSIGESIKEAFWLNNAAGQAEIYLGQNVFNLCSDFIEVEHLPPLTLLGQSAVVECYRLQGLKKNELPE